MGNNSFVGQKIISQGCPNIIIFKDIYTIIHNNSKLLGYKVENNFTVGDTTTVLKDGGIRKVEDHWLKV